MSDVKQVKVDNWGIYFLQRLKHFFNRTDYCDLTLQFQDNAQLKVHRLVLSACTEYFELLERTCEMYEDCLVMPDDLQADVVVPIVNFMYTGHLEFKMELLERLYQTSQILNMPVLSKLLESHRALSKAPPLNYGVKKYSKPNEANKNIKTTPNTKRSYSKAFGNNTPYKDKKASETADSPSSYLPSSPIEVSVSNKRQSVYVDPRPTRYELPEELDTDNVFDNSFCNISYACKPLMIHPDNVKHYSAKRGGIFSEASSSKKLLTGTSTVDIVECKRINKNENIFDDSIPDHSVNDEMDIFNTSYNNDTTKDPNQLFDQILDDGPKVTIETKDSKAASNLDHAKIISEVLKKYPHLVKSNKNIKLKILNTPGKTKRQQKQPVASPYNMEEKVKNKAPEVVDCTYETDVIDSQSAAKLIAMGAENTKGPWICLICGTPGKALHFTTYYKFRRHLVDVHHEKPVSNICEYCGLRSLKRNYLLHHLYSHHNVPPPPQYHFPKCNRCTYIALTEGLLVKHKMSHKDVKTFRCNVCSVPFTTTKLLLQHIQATGHKYSAERKTNLQCIYCLKSFLRDANLYAHLKTYHKTEAKHDGVIEDSDEEKPELTSNVKSENRDKYIKFEPSTSSYDIEYEDVDVQYQIQQRDDGDIQVIPRKQHNVVAHQQHNVILNQKQKILNPGFDSPKPAQKAKPARKPLPAETSNFLEDINIPSPPSNNHNEEEIVLIDNVEYTMRDNQLIPRKTKSSKNDYVMSDIIESASLQAVQPAASVEYTNIHNTKSLEDTQAGLVKNTQNINQPIQIVVSNEEEYKALMASNPILFDNGDANKTLTVLTAPHNASIQSATIDMENTQPNDMMIIQDEFSLNVTEAVSTDNSNIVVVYSHPVDDQNKPFQILTTGGIGSQFVQTSAIITQNYETVTTSAPVMSVHELEPQVVDPTTWQENVIQATVDQEMQIDSESVLQNVVENVSAVQNVEEPCESEPCNNLNELPEVQLSSEPQTIVTNENIQNDAMICELNIEENNEPSCETEQNIVEEPQKISEILTIEPSVSKDSTVEDETSAIIEPMEISQEDETIAEEVAADCPSQETINQVDCPSQETINQADGISQETINQADGLSQETISPCQETINQESIQLIMKPESIVDQPEAVPTEIVPEVCNTVAESIETCAVTENDNDHNNILEEPQPLPESQAYDEIADVNQELKEDEQLPPIKEAEEKIQNLTSEWSEDEYDVIEDTPVTANKIPAPEVAPELPTTQLEETIENIQQEVLNHVITTSAITATIESITEVDNDVSENTIPEEDVVLSPQEPQIPLVTETVLPIQSDPEAQEKISSLLNDWEDNDSQEENNSQGENIETPIASEQESEPVKCNPELNDVKIEKIPKTDNIKNLVSDWDEEEEEIKQ